MPPLVFDAELLAEAAVQQCGSSDFGEPSRFPAFEVLVRSICEEAQIAKRAVEGQALLLVRSLVRRARVAELMRTRPEIRDVPLPRPVFITGLPRTGTTLLHNLLACHPAHRVAPLWELRALVRPENLSEDRWERVSIAGCRTFLDGLRRADPEFSSVHPMDASWPEECNWLTRLGFGTMYYAMTYHVPSYVEWLATTDLVPYYRLYRLLLQILQWQRPGGRWILKDPFHLWSLGALMEVFPDAQVVILHRSLHEAVPSFASLIQHIRTMSSGPDSLAATDARSIGAYTADLVECGLSAMTTVRPHLSQARIHDVAYRDLVRDPVGVVRTLCMTIGSEIDGEAVLGLSRWIAENASRHGPGRHTYNGEAFWLQRAGLEARFGWYSREFLSESDDRT